ncbi:sensor histidine kinase [Lysobacter pythonis]|uniref:Sensor histidine kinase n=1 Tax=Solilutibacter pythonis TaxID=2483112 RepID=A0A3M2HYX0_9GAMM|nr:sensor histidine kinase [Lysobacter pythonis]RMH93043.1 sensor histidine kinase [Lysobacter pythonis]
MPASIPHVRLLRYAGLFTWAMVGAPLVFSALVLRGQGGESQPPVMGLLGWMAYLIYGGLYFWLTTRLGRVQRRNSANLLVLVSLLACAVAVSHFSGTGLGGILMVVAATTLPWFLSVPLGMALLVVSQMAIAPLFVWWWGFDWASAILQSMVYAGFSAFSFVAGLVARQQTEAREQQRRLNAELRATRALLAESVRVNERTRIARELHDLLGHHLTALSLNLEVAGHLVEGQAAGHVRQSHALAKLLLTDVREAVSQMHEDASALHVAGALRPLAENVPGLAIEMDVPDELVVDDAERAHVLLRSVQEIITNAVRHSGASRLAITLRREGDAIHIVARDDGRGTDSLRPGNGLRGLSERLRQYGGEASVDTAPGAGFALTLRLPLEDACGDIRPSLQARGVAA